MNYSLGTQTQRYFENRQWPQFIRVPGASSIFFDVWGTNSIRTACDHDLKLEVGIAIGGSLEVWERDQLGTFVKPPWNIQIVVALHFEKSCAIHKAQHFIASIARLKKYVSDISLRCFLFADQRLFCDRLACKRQIGTQEAMVAEARVANLQCL